MVNLMPIILCTIGFCNALGQNQEKKMLDSLLNQFVTDRGMPLGLHRQLEFLGLPSNLDVSSLTFDDPIRMYKFQIDTSLVRSTDFKIKNVIMPLDAWKIPFKYNEHYCSSIMIEKSEGNYVISDIKQNDTEQWINVERRVAKDKRKNSKLLYYGNVQYLHFPEIDDYNLLPLQISEDVDTSSKDALNSPVKVNIKETRERLRKDIFNAARSNGKRGAK